MAKKRKKTEKANNGLKTTQVLTRPMGEFNVYQRTSDGMFNATSLLKQWNEANPGEERCIDNFWKATHLDKLMFEIVVNEYDSSYVKSTDERNKEFFNNMKKRLTQTSKANKGINSGTWMHPVLFVKFAMYLSPRFEYSVLKFVADDLINYRIDAGIEYKEVGRVVSKIVEKDFLRTAMENVGRAINYVVYNKHEAGIRNKVGCEDKMKELASLEKNIVMLIDCGFVKTYEHLMNFLRGQWIDKWQPRELRA